MRNIKKIISLTMATSMLAASMDISVAVAQEMGTDAIIAEVEVTESVPMESTNSDFVIDENGVLIEYKGAGGDVVIPEGITSISGDAFRGCSSLTGIELPSGLSSIDHGTFWGCSSLRSIKLPNSVTSIGDYAFAECSSLTSIELPNSVERIGLAAFAFCSSLTSIELPSSLTSIRESAFGSCSSLTSIELPKNVVNIEDFAFSGCSGLEKIIVDEGNSVYDSRGNCNAIIETETNTLVLGCKNSKILDTVTNIGKHAFKSCSGLISIEIPSSVTSIGDSAFDYCTNLKNIEVPSSVERIGDYAFSNCTSLKSIEIPSSVESIGNYAFYICSSLETIKVDEKNCVYDSRENCNAIIETETNTLIVGCKNSKIPDNVTNIGNYAFRYCSQLISIQIPSSVTSIDDSAFSGCSGLEKIIVDEGNNVYDSRGNCNAIIETGTNTLVLGCKNSKMPSNVMAIGNQAFCGCSGLTRIEIPSGVKRIGYYAFAGCSSLKSVSVPSSVKYLEIGCLGYSTNGAGFTIYGYKGTAAETYAKQNGFKFVELDSNITPPPMVFTYATITSKDITKTYGAKAFGLGAKVDSNGKLTYTSSDTKVATVSSAGKVTLTGYGKTTITIKAAAKGNYKAAQKKIVLTVKPKTMSAPSLKSAKAKNLTVSWKKDAKATGYVLQYSTDKNFKKNVKTVTISKAATTSKKISKLTSKKKYYVRVCAYKKISGGKLTGSYSKAKSVTIK